MGDLVATAVLQLRAHAGRARRSTRSAEQKQSGMPYQRPANYDRIHMPSNTGAGVVMGLSAAVAGLRADLAHLVAGRSSASSA